MKIILLGAPGAGKGTQSELLCKKINIPKISTGDILRSKLKDRSEDIDEVRKIMGSGKLIPDQMICDIIKQRITEEDCINGYLFDGFPRNVKQAKYLVDFGVIIDHIVDIIVDDDFILESISGRRIHPKTGHIYHIKFNPPDDESIIKELVQRDDDKSDVIKKRLAIYKEHNKILLDFYDEIHRSKKLDFNDYYHSIDGTLSIDEVNKKILSCLM